MDEKIIKAAAAAYAAWATNDNQCAAMEELRELLPESEVAIALRAARQSRDRWNRILETA